MNPAIAVLVYALAAQAATDARQSRGTQTDQTVQVSRGMRLAVDNYAGEVVIRTWEKDAVRVQARHATRTRISIRTDANAVGVSGLSTSGRSESIDYDITAPPWMAIKIEGQFNYVSVDGVQGEVSIETVRGDIILKNAVSVTAKTIEGEIQVDGARGKLNLSSVNEGIKVMGASGDVTAETTNGSISLSRIESSSVEVTTVNGDVAYEGALADRGRYSFTTHNGDIVLTVADTANATFNVRTYSGDFGTSLSLKGPAATEVRRGKRVAYTLGTGSAEVAVESFGGEIKLRRAGAARTGRNQ